MYLYFSHYIIILLIYYWAALIIIAVFNQCFWCRYRTSIVNITIRFQTSKLKLPLFSITILIAHLKIVIYIYDEYCGSRDETLVI